MKKWTHLALTIQTLIFIFGMTVPAQAAVYAANTNYAYGSVISLRSYQPVYSAPTTQITTTNTSPTTTQTTTPVSTSGSSVISLKNYFYNYSTPINTNTKGTTPTTTNTPATTPATTSPTTTPTTPPTTQTTTAAPSTVTIPAATSISAEEQNMIDQINQERANVGLAPLKVDLRLVGVAQTKANDMKTNGYFSHTSPTYGSPYDMMKMAGVQYYSAGENIARNISVDAAMAAFMSSAGHKANILNSGYTHVGVGIVYSSSGSYYVQEFTHE